MATGLPESVREQLVKSIAKQLAADVPEQSIVDAIARQGVDRNEAHRLVRGVATQELDAMSRAGRRVGPKYIILGAVLFVGGIAVTIGTWLNAANEGGVVFVTYGVILAGLGLIWRGISKMRS
jgi:hypothetical protein